MTDFLDNFSNAQIKLSNDQDEKPSPQKSNSLLNTLKGYIKLNPNDLDNNNTNENENINRTRNNDGNETETMSGFMGEDINKLVISYRNAIVNINSQLCNEFDSLFSYFN